MSSANEFYRVKIGDVEAPYEFVDHARADAFAKGASFVLENLESTPYARSTTTVSVLTFRETWTDNPVTGGEDYKSELISQREY